MLQMLSALLVLAAAGLAVALTARTLRDSWSKVVIALAGPDAPIARRVHVATRLRAQPRRRPVVVSRERVWAAA